MQGRNGDADIENGLVDRVGEGETGTNGQSNTDIHTPPCVKQIAGEKLLHNTGSTAKFSIMIQRGVMAGWGGRRKREVIYV